MKINVKYNYKEKKKRTYILLCSYLSLYFQTMKWEDEPIEIT